MATPDTKATKSLAELRDDQVLWYKICVLVYDLRNMTKDKACEDRTLQTTDELYISAPYFSADEAATIKSATVSDNDNAFLEQTITSNLQNFFEKRRASGDCRPCGPHDMVPVYLECFGIDRAEIENEKFVSRLRRSGPGTK
ncbi:Uu.00g107650.m01.CDS01 [Anthostomella pinea]|uniref:Uu.00g107650.m01.CDS01 n=1 Tax=Anthostomella pinea TaxID=933095 RepID=A0AAI8YDK8_9PEZI|nr:Uu.00g107650.m01.CDS01 [Anthostomella pinea]